MKVVTQYLVARIQRQNGTRDSIAVRKLEVSRLQGRFLKKIKH